MFIIIYLFSYHYVSFIDKYFSYPTVKKIAINLDTLVLKYKNTKNNENTKKFDFLQND